MRIIRINPKHPDPKMLGEAAAVLKAGGLVVYPTETAYALGCDATNRAAMKKIFSVKVRDAGKTLPVIAASVKMVRRFAKLDKMNMALAEAFWPGPLTLVLESAAPHGMAVRVSPHPVANGLSRLLGRPIVSTSANRSGGETPYEAKSVLAALCSPRRSRTTWPDLVLDAGRLPKRKPSTIVRADDCCCEILRPGPVSAKMLLKTLRACA